LRDIKTIVKNNSSSQKEGHKNLEPSLGRNLGKNLGKKNLQLRSLEVKILT